MDPLYFFIQIDLTFHPYVQLDNQNLTALTLFAGSPGANYSDQLAGSFTFTRDGITIGVVGEGFVYSGGVPTAGTADGMMVFVGNARAYQWSDVDSGMTEYPLSIFNSTDPLAIATALFAGNDLIDGSQLNDQIYGFTGDDQISGGNGEDRLFGGDGKDLLYGGRDDDRLFGGAGDDWLNGGPGTNVLKGGEGSDTAEYYRVFSPVVVKLKNEKAAMAKVGIDQVDKLKSIENVTGGAAADKLTGDHGDNVLNGQPGNDILNGKGGNDTLAGDYGYDTLIGGKGDDIYVFDELLAGSKFTNIDTVVGFGNGDDSIHLRQLVFGELTVGALSPENFLAAPGAIGGLNGEQYIVYNTSNGALYYDPTGDGTGSAPLQIATLKGAPHLTAADFWVFGEIVA